MRRPWVVLVALAVALGGCGSDPAPSRFAVSDAWSRPTPSSATNGVVYMTISSDVDDVLVGALAPASIAASTELHTSMLSGSPGTPHHGAGSGGESGGSVAVEQFPVTPAAAVVFEPGGNHVMLIDLAAPLVDGQRFPLTLTFASGRTLTADVLVADNPPG